MGGGGGGGANRNKYTVKGAISKFSLIKKPRFCDCGLNDPDKNTCI